MDSDDDGVVKIWDIRQRSCCHEFKEHEDFISDLMLAEDGRTLLCTGGDGYLSIWNRKSGTLLTRIYLSVICTHGPSSLRISSHGKEDSRPIDGLESTIVQSKQE